MSVTLARNTSLLEILELPQLMETVVRNQHYEEALQLHNYVAKLSKKQPEVRILADIQLQVAASMRLMLQQLVSQLRAPVQLPQCLKVISFLRRMDVFTEAELRLKFLQSREAWLSSVVAAVPRDDPYTHLTRTMELLRVHLFDIVTQYRSIFSDDTDHVINVSAVNTEEKFDNRLLFTSWLSRKVQQFLKTIVDDLDAGVTSFESIMGQAMYFGLSFGRVGFDFRPLLAPVFSAAIEKQFMSKLSPDSTMKAVSESLSSMSLSSVPAAPTSVTSAVSAVSPPLSLLDYPPLAHVTNAVVSALNEVWKCCAYLIFMMNKSSYYPGSVGGAAVEREPGDQQSAAAARRHHRHHARPPHHRQDQDDRRGRGGVESAVSGRQEHSAAVYSSKFSALINATACCNLTLLQVALNAVFPPDKIQSVTGVKNVGTICNLDTETIMKPIAGFVPKEQPVEEIKVPEEFVKERMEEISVAIDQADVEENQKEDSNVEGNEIDSIDAAAGDSEKAEMEENPVKDGKEDSEE